MTPLIDLCSSCVLAVANRQYPTKAFPTDDRAITLPEFNEWTPEQIRNGWLFNWISLKTAQRMMAGDIKVKGQEGETLPMVAMITIDGTRLCSYHCHVRRGRDLADFTGVYTGPRDRFSVGQQTLDCD